MCTVSGEYPGNVIYYSNEWLATRLDDNFQLYNDLETLWLL